NMVKRASSTGGETDSTYGGMKKLHNRLLVFLTALIALSPLPLGSNRPLFWSVNALVVALFALHYVLSLAGRRAQPRIPLRAFALPGGLFCLVVVAMIVQIVPAAPEGDPPAWANAGAALGRDLATRVSV